MKTLPLLFVFYFLHLLLPAQGVTQVLRGTIMDKESDKPLEGATLAIYKDSTLITGTNSDEKGHFRFDKTPVGRITLVITYVGYQKIIMPNILINSGKEQVLNFEMQSSIETKNEVVINGRTCGESINSMSLVGDHTFTVEETDRYAGSRGDPARMVENYAGVNGTDDSQNNLVVRGNSPFGVLYQVDGVAIPTPNHFAIAGETGGSVAILDNKMLTTSDFYTGAFPAEFGNAVAGVFDINLKNGNDERSEYTAQVGVLGAEAFGEGPFGSDSKASYIFNFRYATLQGLQAMGVNLGTTAVPKYQDAQFKLNFPLKNGDNISVFGIGGTSQINFLTSEDKSPSQTDIYATPDQNEYFRAGMGVIGATYTHLDNDNSYSKFSIAASTIFNGDNFFRVVRHVNPTTGDYVVDTLYQKERYQMFNSRYTAAYVRNTKLNARSSLRYGISVELYTPFLYDSNLLEPAYNPGLENYEWQIRLNARHPTPFSVMQPYVQWKYIFSDKLSMVTGLHGEYMTLNNSWSVEPRFSIKYQLARNQSLAFATGLYSEMLPIYQYYVQDSTGNQYNKNLGLIHSYHAVLGYDVFLGKDIHIKLETYYEWLWNIPVDTMSSSYSVMDEGSGFDQFYPGKLVNKGLGQNYGLEGTFEKFFTHNWFIMFTGSLYNSLLTGSDGKWWNSDYNGKFIINLLGTKEFKWTKGARQNTIGIGGKITYAGGLPYTLYDTTLSRLHQDDPVLQNNTRNQLHYPNYFRFDIKLNYKCNTHRFTHEVGLDLINVTGQKNWLRIEYVSPSNPEQVLYQLGFLPLLYYRLDFWIGKKNW